ncbi:GntR family transcriptional regulator [Galbitalea soli]|uniref:GntR family transcriptional regulator n=1 Tax=Galbitalea soli TaxID=1268042 RepID=A0A7C9PNB6_9MICO|nr:GntR family transcriptional regulator [Galbitalea soli]NEM91505.1 GntR family transcriptional regulator [Galbitalea soli]NYJ30198.1 DNA-binding GntR family transcriptional regulator [Galbitalea soli]
MSATDTHAARTRSDEDVIRGGVLRFVREAALEFQALPGELEIAKRLDCSRQQVRHALADLERQGVVIRRQGAATVVDPLALRMSVRLEDQLEHSELLERMGYRAEVEVIDSGFTPLTRGIASILTPDADATAFRVVKRWRADGTAAMVAENTLTFPAGARPELDPEQSVFSLAEQVWGESIVWEVATPGVTTIDEAAATPTGLPLGSAALTLEIIGVTASGRRVFHAAETHNPQIVTYSFVRTVSAPWVNPHGADSQIVRHVR